MASFGIVVNAQREAIQIDQRLSDPVLWTIASHFKILAGDVSGCLRPPCTCRDRAQMRLWRWCGDVKPEVLCIDELGYLPIDKFGADCLFQIISHRYERGATLLTTNRIYKQWADIFNGDATLTSALLDRLLDHVETVLIDGKSYRRQAHAEA